MNIIKWIPNFGLKLKLEPEHSETNSRLSQNIKRLTEYSKSLTEYSYWIF